MLFSINETTLPKGKHKILTRTSDSKLDISKAVIAAKDGTPIAVEYYDIPLEQISSPVQEAGMRVLSYAPNPTDGRFTLYYYLPEYMDELQLAVYDLTGSRVYHDTDLTPSSGYAQKEIDLGGLNKGIYICVLHGGNTNARDYTQTFKIVIK
jgi:hypothetical protein